MMTGDHQWKYLSMSNCHHDVTCLIQRPLLLDYLLLAMGLLRSSALKGTPTPFPGSGMLFWADVVVDTPTRKKSYIILQLPYFQIAISPRVHNLTANPLSCFCRKLIVTSSVISHLRRWGARCHGEPAAIDWGISRWWWHDVHQKTHEVQSWRFSIIYLIKYFWFLLCNWISNMATYVPLPLMTYHIYTMLLLLYWGCFMLRIAGSKYLEYIDNPLVKLFRNTFPDQVLGSTSFYPSWINST